MKIYFLQQWYNLSDPGVEEAIYDRNSFPRFLDLDLLKVLDKHHLIIREETILDATIINAPRSTKNEDGKRDSEMSSTKKGNNWYFGMKDHIGVDHKSGIVHSIKTTTTKIHDKQIQTDLLHGQEKSIFGDKGYYKEENKREMRDKGIFCGILDKAKRGQALSFGQKKKNNKLSSVRAKVEHPFRVVKCQFGYTKLRYKGLLKNTIAIICIIRFSKSLYKQEEINKSIVVFIGLLSLSAVKVMRKE